MVLASEKEFLDVLEQRKSTEIQTESNVIYLADVRYWNRDIELYVQFVAA